MTDHTSPIYAKNENELSWPIWQGTIYDKDQTEGQRDWSYKCGLRGNHNSNVMTD